ncbi:unnamed protein product [Pylaiella littoralis]
MTIEKELSGLNRELSMFPERAFDFKTAGTKVVIQQDVADVGSVVWDAEVLLAHYLDQAYGPQLRGMRVLELGAGTGLAGIVAARLGASVVLTDQSKILPTLVRNARANAQDLECRRRPIFPDCCGDDTPSFADDADHSEDILKSFPEPKNGAHTTAFMSTVSLARASSPTSSRCRHDNDNPTCTNSAMRHQCGGGYHYGDETSNSKSPKQVEEASSPCCDGGDSTASGVRCCFCGATSSGNGRWRVEELLFSKNKEELRRWCGVTFGRGDSRKYSRIKAEDDHREDLFDLVVAADVVYLNGLWDSIACTLKAMLKPSGEALMTFEQRRSNVDGFFGPPRFGEHGDSWEHGEELDFGKGVFTATELGNAAKASRVRLFRMRRRDGVS